MPRSQLYSYRQVSAFISSLFVRLSYSTLENADIRRFVPSNSSSGSGSGKADGKEECSKASHVVE